MVLALLVDSGWAADSLRNAVPREPELVNLRNSTLWDCAINDNNKNAMTTGVKVININ